MAKYLGNFGDICDTILLRLGICSSLQFSATPAPQRDLPADVLRLTQRISNEKGIEQHHGNRNSEVV